MKDFFKLNPGAPGLLKVGEQYFLLHFRAEAELLAAQTGHPLEEIPNPAKAEKAETTEKK